MKKKIIVLISIMIIVISFIIIQFNVNKNNSKHEYNIYLARATLPTFFSLMDLTNEINAQGFYYVAKTDIVNIDEIKENNPTLYISENCGKREKTDFNNLVIPEVTEYVKKILQEDEKAHFTLYLDEYNFYAEFPIFVELGLEDERYDVKLFSDGTLSYAMEYEIRQENQYDNYIAKKEKYNQILEDARKGRYRNGISAEHLKSETDNQYYLGYDYDYIYISALRKNITYYLQFPEMIKFKDEKIQEEMKKANIQKIVAQEEYSKLSEEKAQQFFEYINLNKDELQQKYFNQEDGKYLVITGANPFYENKTEEEFKNIIKKVNEKYSKEYVILYKPHPSALPNEEQQQFLNEQNIKVLPGKIPMEAICFIYPNLKLGGFGSSLYMSVDEGKTLFFFEKDKEELVEPLGELYDDLFYQAEFINAF